MKKIYIEKELYYNVYKSGKRTVYSPCKKLKALQREILSIIKLKYKIRLETKTAAVVHCNQKWLLKTDIEKFYEAFSSAQIKEAIDDFYCNIIFPQFITKEKLFKVCTIEGKLPTGAATSSHIANYAFMKTGIDDSLMKFCKESGINYSRYMDDMFFSCDSKRKLKAAEKLAMKLLNASGFRVNEEKTKYISDNKKQEVLGLVVNNGIAPVIARDEKHKYRSVIFNYLKSVFLEERLGIDTLFLKRIGFKEICGYLSYFKTSDYLFYSKMRTFILAKISQFKIEDNIEIIKLKKILK